MPCKIAVLSGKGGTGKTLVSVNLAAAIALLQQDSASTNVCYADCDVEEPNGHLFFKPTLSKTVDVGVLVPHFDMETCISCRACVDFCKFNALAMLKKPLLFSEICHSCGGCAKICPVGAITEIEKNVGEVSIGSSDGVRVITGTMKPGEASGTPIIREIFHSIETEKDEVIIIDCPPGSACLAMDAIKDADFCVLVGEPTIFGAHNFSMVYELVKLFKKPFGAVLNKCDEGENPSEDFCTKNNIPILTRIPFSNELGEINSNGRIATRENEAFKTLFSALFETIKKTGVRL